MKKLFTILIGIFSLVGLVLFFTSCQNNIKKQNKEINLGAGGNTNSIDLELDNSQYLSITDANQTGLDITGDISFECWVKLEELPSTNSATMMLIAKWKAGSGSDQSYLFQLGSDDKLGIDYNDGSAQTTIVANTATVVAGDVGSWVHLAGTVDVSASTGTLYKNGTAIDATVNGTTTSIQNGAGDFTIGVHSGGTTYFDGLIDDVRVWNDIRTATEISDNYQKELVGDEANLVGYWKLNNDLLDETSNNNDLTNNNSAVFSSDVPFTGGGTRRIIIIQ